MNNNEIVTVSMDIESLKDAEYNPRSLSNRAYTQLKKSIVSFGLMNPIIVNKHKGREGVIIGGHQRVRIFKDLGFKTITTNQVDLSLDKERELNVRLNKNTGDWDKEKLVDFFNPNELLDWGFESKEITIPEASSEELTTVEMDKMDIQANEHHDYIVLYFDNMHDYLWALQKMDIKKRDHSISDKSKDIGLGRVLNGVKAIKKLTNEEFKEDNNK